MWIRFYADRKRKKDEKGFFMEYRAIGRCIS